MAAPRLDAEVLMRARICVVLACGLLALACQRRENGPANAAQAKAPTATAAAGDAALPFHSEMAWTNTVSAPQPGCNRSLPAGVSHLWLSHVTGTATSTHLGTGPYEADLCVTGTLTDPQGPPGKNGAPSGWYVIREVWVADNGDRLLATGEMVGVTAPPGTPGSRFIDSVRFLDGGTGRFELAAGEGKGYIDAATQRAVYDGTIRFSRKQ
jgi:hypothetical protein